MAVHRFQAPFANERQLFDNKLAFKKLVADNDLSIKTPQTYAVMNIPNRYNDFWQAQSGKSEFVIKPNHLSRGQLIYVFKRKNNGELFEHDGTM